MTPTPEGDPIFIVGFPRSGTTLLEQTLDAHPLLKSMDEQPFLKKAHDAVSEFGIRYPAELGKLSAEQLHSIRAGYWERVRKKIDLRPVPYHGSAAGLADLVAGHIPIEITTTADLVQMAEAGRIRVLATSNRQRSPFLPNVPTLREAGYDLVASGWYGMFAPAKTPPEVIERLNKVIVDAVHSSDVEHRFLAFGLQPTGTSAAAFADIQKDDSEKWAPAVKASGFRPEE